MGGIYWGPTGDIYKEAQKSSKASFANISFGASAGRLK